MVHGLAIAGLPQSRARLLALAAGGDRGPPARRLQAAARRLAERDPITNRSPGPTSPSLDTPETFCSDALPPPVGSACAGQLAGSALESLDLAPHYQDSPLSYANHPAVPSRMGATRSGAIADANVRAGREDFPGDISCCASISAPSSQQTFGSFSDGLDIIEDWPEQLAVLSNPISRVKVVRQILFCGGPGTNIIGCAWLGNNGVALVRMSSLARRDSVAALRAQRRPTM
jgi:hypothetical protein